MLPIGRLVPERIMRPKEGCRVRVMNLRAAVRRESSKCAQVHAAHQATGRSCPLQVSVYLRKA